MHTFRYSCTGIDHLRKRDRKLGRAIDEIGRYARPDIFTALVASVESQQASSKAAETVWHRMEKRSGTITPAAIAAAILDKIQQCGLSMKKAGYIKGIGNAVMNGNLDLAGLHSRSDDEVIARITALKGVGIWTAGMILIFSMARPDVVSRGDLAIRRGMMILYGTYTIERAQFERYRKRYPPYGSVASLYLRELSHR